MPALLLLLIPASLSAQQTPAAIAAPAAAPVAAPTPPSSAPAAPCKPCIPALTPVTLVLDADLGSKISRTGDMFPLHLAQPIVIDGDELVPAGTPGQGEVIHAKKAGGSGTAGELVLAARFLTVGSRQLRLRSMRVGGKAVDAVGKIDAFNAATVMSPVPVAIIGFALTGHNNMFAKGTLAVAKTAELFDLAPAMDAGSTHAIPAKQQASSPASAQNKEKQDEKDSDKSGADPVGSHDTGSAGTGG